MEALLDVISVKTRDDYTLELVFENGEKRIFDMKPFFDKKPFVKLLNSPLFFKASAIRLVKLPSGISLSSTFSFDLRSLSATSAMISRST